MNCKLYEIKHGKRIKLAEFSDRNELCKYLTELTNCKSNKNKLVEKDMKNKKDTKYYNKLESKLDYACGEVAVWNKTDEHEFVRKALQNAKEVIQYLRRENKKLKASLKSKEQTEKQTKCTIEKEYLEVSDKFIHQLKNGQDKDKLFREVWNWSKKHESIDEDFGSRLMFLLEYHGLKPMFFYQYNASTQGIKNDALRTGHLFTYLFENKVEFEDLQNYFEMLCFEAETGRNLNKKRPEINLKSFEEYDRQALKVSLGVGIVG